MIGDVEVEVTNRRGAPRVSTVYDTSHARQLSFLVEAGGTRTLLLSTEWSDDGGGGFVLNLASADGGLSMPQGKPTQILFKCPGVTADGWRIMAERGPGKGVASVVIFRYSAPFRVYSALGGTDV